MLTRTLLITLMIAGAWRCTDDDRLPMISDTFLEAAVGIDEEERLLLYNESGYNSPRSAISLDDSPIALVAPDSLIEIGSPYAATWRDEPYTFYKTQFPIIKIQSERGQITEKRYASAKLAVIDDGEIVLSSNLGIKLRGNTSLGFSKKSYRLELWEDESGTTTRQERILGMRKDDDWLLDGMWNEPLSIRDMTAMEIWLAYGRGGQDTGDEETRLGAERAYCELFVDGRYQGIYYIGERLDKKQLRLEDYSGAGSGGELYKAKG